MRTLAIGDIHGCSGMLDDLLGAVQPAAADQLVFLGDYVDRGPDSRGVIDRLLALRRTHNVVCLRGNHELMMSRARRDKGEYKMWTSVGGVQALGSYGKAPGRAGAINDIPTEHWRFIDDECVDYYETDRHIFVHAGLVPGVPMNEQGEEHLFWEFLNTDFPWTHVSGKTIVCGHSSQKSGEIFDGGTALCIDTHAYGGGWLTCLDADSRRYWQANVIGAIRTGIVGHPR